MTATTSPTTAAGTSPRLTPVRRARVLTRRALFAGLQLIPDRVVAATHDRWIDVGGRRNRWLRPVADLMFYRPVPHSTITVPGGAGERLVVVGTRMERTIWWYGENGYEAGEAATWRTLCAEAFDVLELGANVGYYSVVGARATGGSYTAVEPNPEAAAVIRRNVALNGLDRAEVVEVAAVGRGAPEHLELALPDQESHSAAPTGSFLREGTEGVDDRAATRSITVRTMSAATLFEGRDLVKLDCEGSEAAILDAAREQIRRSRPTILLEFLSGSSHLRAVIGELVGDGYTLYDAGSPYTPIRLDDLPDIGYRDVLLIPGRRDDDG